MLHVHNGFCTHCGSQEYVPEGENYCVSARCDTRLTMHCPSCWRTTECDEFEEAYCHFCKGGEHYYEHVVYWSSYRFHLDEGCPISVEIENTEALNWEQQLVLEDYLQEHEEGNYPEWVWEMILKR